MCLHNIVTFFSHQPVCPILSLHFTYSSVYHSFLTLSPHPTLQLLFFALAFSFPWPPSLSALFSQEFWLACTPTLSLGAPLGFQLIYEKKCNIITIYYTCLINSHSLIRNDLNFGRRHTHAEQELLRSFGWAGSLGNLMCLNIKLRLRTIWAGMTLCLILCDFYEQLPTGHTVCAITSHEPVHYSSPSLAHILWSISLPPLCSRSSLPIVFLFSWSFCRESS